MDKEKTKEWARKEIKKLVDKGRYKINDESESILMEFLDNVEIEDDTFSTLRMDISEDEDIVLRYEDYPLDYPARMKIVFYSDREVYFRFEYCGDFSNSIYKYDLERRVDLNSFIYEYDLEGRIDLNSFIKVYNCIKLIG